MEILLICMAVLIIILMIILNFYSNEIIRVNKTIMDFELKISEQEEINETLKKEIKYLTKVNKTFSDGLDALKKKQGGL